MPAKRKFDVCVGRPKYNSDGVWWHRLGNAIENEKGQIVLFLDSIPAPNPEGQYQMTCFESKPKDDADSEKGSGRRRSSRSSQQDNDDEEIPF